MRPNRSRFTTVRVRSQQPSARRLREHRFGRDEFRRVGLDDVTLLEIRETRDLHAALEVLRNLAHVVLEAPQRLELRLEHDGGVAQYPYLRVARQLAALHVTTGDRADLRHLEHLANLRPPEDNLAELRRKHAEHRLLEIVLDV